jgi:hypothetical protein
VQLQAASMIKPTISETYRAGDKNDLGSIGTRQEMFL